MGVTGRAKEKLEDAAGGVRGVQREDEEGREPDEGRFEPEEARRRKRPKDALPQPENFRPPR